MTKTYIANRVLYLMSPWGIIDFVSQGTGSIYVTDQEHIQSFIERTGEYRNGVIVLREAKLDPAKIVDTDPASKVKNAKQAIEWLVRNKGEKRGFYTKEKIRELAATHGVEFPNWK